MAVAQRIYASALFDAAKERDALADVRRELADFVGTLRGAPELDAALRNPQLDPRAKSAVVGDVTRGSHELVRNFLLLVVEKGRADEIDGIAREFEEFCRHEEGVLNVELTTAYELTEEERRSVVDQIERASGRRVDATSSVDPDLIGGLVLRADSMRLDASVRGRLERLRQELTTAGSLRD
ncbi:MAG: ATP synthase F1 subunit delta [Actinomycetota bacterium]|nr:ATP synthase F1 subunit delta [Actinomycetota bacterium]